MQRDPDYTDFEDTRPAVARWDCDISGEGLWIWRCALRMLQLRVDIDLDQAYDFAQELSLDHLLRARLPEHVAEDMVREHRWPS
jgi:hypothetical protein